MPSLSSQSVDGIHFIADTGARRQARIAGAARGHIAPAGYLSPLSQPQAVNTAIAGFLQADSHRWRPS